MPVWAGGARLISYGGEGTPTVEELCAGELAVALHLHPAAACSLIADALEPAGRQ